MSLFKKKKKESALTEAPGALPAQQQAPLPPRPGRENRPETPKPDAYFRKLAGRSRIARYVVTVALLLFIVGMAFLYSSEITAENFGLLLRNASFSFPGESTAFETVRYDADLKMDFAPYKQYLAVATTTGVKLYDHRGNVVFGEEYAFENPSIRSGEDYLMVYDKEGKNYLICNSVMLMKEEKSEHILYDADMSDKGRYLLVESSSQYLSVLTVCNRSFNVETQMKIDRYPVKAELSRDGSRLLFLSYKAGDDGLPEGHADLYTVAEKTDHSAALTFDEIPLGGCLTDSGALILLRDKVVFYNDGQTAELVFDHTPSFFRLCQNVLILGTQTDKVLGKTLLRCYDYNTGEKIGETTFQGRLRDVYLDQGLLFLAENETLHVLSLENGQERALSLPLPRALFALGEGNLFVCYPNKAENIESKIDRKALTPSLQKDETDASAAGDPNEPEGA